MKRPRGLVLADLIFLLYMAWVTMPEADRSTVRAAWWHYAGMALRSVARTSGTLAIEAERRYYKEVTP